VHKFQQLEMWVNAQREYMAALPNIGGALCSTPQFGWRPLLECHAVMLPRRETHWNYRVHTAVPTTAVPTTAVPTTAIPTTAVPTTVVLTTVIPTPPIPTI